MITVQTDSKFIIRSWSKINRGPLKRSAGYVRKVMRSSIRRRKKFTKTGRRSKVSPKGKPPYSRHPSAPMKFITFSLVNDGSGAIVGPKYLPIKKQDRKVTPMQAHEFGKTVRVRIPKRRRKKARTKAQREAARKLALEGKIERKKIPVTTKLVKMPKRPFAQPALEKSAPKLNEFWKDSVNRTTARSKVK